jgi:hypothetical protein
MSLSPAEMALEKMHGADMLWVVGLLKTRQAWRQIAAIGRKHKSQFSL